MGEVFLAEDTKLGRQVALKLLPSELAGDVKRRQRFITKAKAASALNHPNVCTIYEVGEKEDRRSFIVMEYVDGQTLEKRGGQSRLLIGQILDIAVQIADALDAAYERGVIHRDIKPANITVNRRGQAKVLDIGLAKRVADDRVVDLNASTQFQTQAGHVLGTPNYMSPEQALGREVDHRTDIFSLGVVIYELTAGRQPFAGASFGDTVNKVINLQPESLSLFYLDVTPEFERIIFKCLEKDPARRYQKPSELVADLHELKRDIGNQDTSRGRPDSQPVRPPSQDTAFSPQQPHLPAKAQPVEELKQSDIFISYASVDDQPLSTERQGLGLSVSFRSCGSGGTTLR